MKIRNQYLSNLLKLTSSSVLAQLLLIISSPILTRLYSPKAFGVYALFIGIIGILSTVSNLRYEQAIIIPKEDVKSIQLIYLSLFINIIFSSLLFLFLFLFSEIIFKFFKIEDLVEYYWIIPIAVFFIGCFQVFNYWLIRNKKFNKISKIKIQQSAVIITIQLVFYKIGAIALILGHSAGQLLGVIKNGYIFLKTTKSNRSEIRQVASEYKNFPIYSTWSALLNSTGAQLPVLIFTAYYSPAVAGLYMLTQRVIKGPLSIVSQAVTQIFISNLRNEENKIKKKLLGVNNFLTSIVIIPFAIIIVAGNKIFSLVFGSNWAEAGTVAAILSPWMFLVFICSPISSLIEYKGKQTFFLKFQIILFLSRIIFIYIGYLIFDGYIKTLILFSFISTSLWFFLLYYIMRLFKIGFLEWSKSIFKKIIYVSFIFFVFYIIQFQDNFYYWLFMFLFTIISIYFVYDKGLLKNES